MQGAIAIGLASNIIENGEKQRTVTVLFLPPLFPLKLTTIYYFMYCMIMSFGSSN